MTARAPVPTSPRSIEVSVGVSQAALGFLLSSLGACLVLSARDFGVPRGDFTWLSAGFGAALLLFGAVGPWLLRAGAGTVLRASAAGLGIGAVLFAAAPSVLVIQVGALLLGTGGAGIAFVTPALLSGPKAASRLARVTAAGMVAGISAPVLISAADALAGNGRLALLVPLPGLLWLAVIPAGAAARGAGPPASSPIIGKAAPMGVASAWICIVLAVSAEFGFVVWGAARMQDSGLSAAAAAAAAAAFPLGMAVGRLAAPWFVERTAVIAPGAALAVIGSIAVVAPTGPGLATAALGLAGLGIAALYPVTLARLVRTPGLSVRRGAALGAAASGTAVLVAPAALHALAARTSLRESFLAVTALLALLFALEHLARRRARRGRGEDARSVAAGPRPGGETAVAAAEESVNRARG